MTFDSLSIISLCNNETLAYYKFNSVGLNIILGEKRADDDDTNGVGKSALLLAIRYCISENMPDAFKKKQEFVKQDAYALLSIIIDGKVQRIRRCLFDDKIISVTDNDSVNDFSTIGWDNYEKRDFATYIQNVMFADISLKLGSQFPTFASVCEFLMRSEKQGYATGIKLPNRSPKMVAKCLAFLSLVQCNFEDQLSVLKSKIKELNEEKALIDIIGADIKNIREKRRATLIEIENLKKMLADASVEKKIKYDQQNYSLLKHKIDILQRQIYRLEFAKKQHEKNIQDLEKNLEKAKNFSELKDFYDQILQYFPKQLSDNYEQMRLFYQAMLANRGSYFNDQIKKISEQLEPLYYQQNMHLSALSEITRLMKGSELVADLQQISEQIAEKYNAIAEYEYKIKIYANKAVINKKISKSKEDLAAECIRLKSLFEDNDTTIQNIEKHYIDLVKVSSLTPNAIQGSLKYSFEDSTKINKPMGRINIDCQLTDQESYGRGNLSIILFDLALLLNRIDSNAGLLFLFHDGPYVQLTSSKIKFNILKYVDKYLKKYNSGQYFVTLNVEELNESVTDDSGSNTLMIKYFENRNAVVATLIRTEDSSQRCMGFKY